MSTCFFVSCTDEPVHVKILTLALVFVHLMFEMLLENKKQNAFATKWPFAIGCSHTYTTACLKARLLSRFLSVKQNTVMNGSEG